MVVARVRAGIVALLLAGLSSAALAEDASPWDATARSAVRLISGAAATESGTKILRAGIEIRLDPGWKTYWRYPGDAGVPPRFNFVRSENLESVRVLWPAPRSFLEEGVRSIGYVSEVIFPLHIRPLDPSRPVLLRFDVEYAICERVCVPADGRGELLLSGEAGPQEESLRRAETQVPKLVGIGEGEGVVIDTITRGAGNGRIIVTVRGSDPGKLELFAEGPSPDWALPVPEPIAGGPEGSQRFAFELDGLPPGASTDGVSLRLTAVAGEQAIEVDAPLDAIGAPHGE